MTDKINLLPGQRIATSDLRPAGAGRAGQAGLTAGSPVGSVDGAQLRLSEEAARLSQSTAGEPAFDAARVDRIRNALLNGTYKVDTQVVAQRLGDIERSLKGL